MTFFNKRMRTLHSCRPLWLLVLVTASAAANASPEPELWLPESIPAPPEEGPALCVGDFLTPEQGTQVLEAALEAFPDRASWNAYAGVVRERIQTGSGLMPWPKRTPLNVRLSRARHYEGYSVANIAFESVPGFWVTGNLYRPTAVPPPFAAVLHTHGHSAGPEGEDGWLGHGRFKPDVQIRAAALARMGAVSLTIDMFGYGDGREILGVDAHRRPLAMKVQMWNAIRAVDFLRSLDDVDSGRIAATGHSGGGTQAFLLAALDERIRVNVPVAMVSSWFFGGCPCESGRPIHRSEVHFANNVMIAALSAPRPLLLVSDGGDWTNDFPQSGFPFLKTIFSYYGQPEAVKNVHLPDEGHDYGASKRAAMYPFMERHLGLDLRSLQTAGGAFDESGITIEDPVIMRVFGEGEALPAATLRSAGEIERVLRELQK